MEKPLDGLKALVTGAASGIGLATARALQERGADVVGLDRDENLIDGLQSVKADVTDSNQVDTAVTDAVAVLGSLDILVNNAGIPFRGRLEDTTDADWHRVLDTNVVGMARVIRASLPHLRRSPSPAIVNTCSVSASVGLEGLPIYSASKGAIAAFTRALAADLLGDRIRVNCVSPGTVDTPWMHRVFAESTDPAAAFAAASARQPFGRMVSAAEVAAAITFLASPDAASITGIELPVDGGMASLRPAPK